MKQVKQSNESSAGWAMAQENNKYVKKHTACRCDEKKDGQHCPGAKTCESLAGLLFNFRMIWGA